MRNNRKLKRLSAFICGVLACCSMMAVSAFAADGAAYTEKSCNLSPVYGFVALISVVLVAVYLIMEKQREKKFVMLYGSVAVANIGYFTLSVSSTLDMALWANRIGYLGSAFAVLTMLIIVADVCHVRLSPLHKAVLVIITTAAVALAATGGWLDIYYSSVSLETVNGTSKLVKHYAPLHILYPIYVLSYFAAMVACIAFAAKRKKLASARYAVFLAAVVLGNIAVWGVEQLINVDFEFLSISYVATELMLLLLRGLMTEYEKKVSHEADMRREMAEEMRHRTDSEGELPPNIEELFSSFAERVTGLTPTERNMLRCYIEGCSLEDFASKNYISINTAKKHNTNLNRKLELKSREELSLYIDLFRRAGRLEEITYIN